ncbi:PTS system mannose/fructose/sorbose family transporter subunit IID [Companilactobacillus halodurans]|uniref:PTS system mannose/fructose/sorbose family transporter subunit IID n=1 Tax=Companilactobacillus halodurans TaxID=2584183 RepID=A0A5P0ZZV8_9LACO|nr:PTS system mannose/fructose/sorbose family transporter subunit IID [Companilactobacillus halodurans]MQS76318.1 PTS system mannose/fructose/sorbose family transporter subunit IID [Companilactobacillus halodurans]MQS98599.1 PTS system mannose/fructose/sorbose family transporter subunit IID [Companilactobacillus halodurans]
MTTSKQKVDTEITKKDLRKVFWKSLPFEISWNYVRQDHMGFAYSMSPIIKKLYKTREDRAAALKRHMEFFNITVYFSTLVLGIVTAMEKKNAEDGKEFDATSINNIKASLMGPLSGIGDSLFLGTLRVIAAGIGASLAMKGSILGAILFLILYNVPAFAVRYIGMMQGYKMGTSFLDKISESGLMDKVTKLTGILGLMTIGSMVATMVVMKTPLTFGTGSAITKVQSILDSIMPKLLPAMITGVIYWLLNKKIKTTTILILIIAFSIVCAYFGILSA